MPALLESLSYEMLPKFANAKISIIVSFSYTYAEISCCFIPLKLFLQVVSASSSYVTNFFDESLVESI